jgi:hypothetical protein
LRALKFFGLFERGLKAASDFCAFWRIFPASNGWRGGEEILDQSVTEKVINYKDSFGVLCTVQFLELKNINLMRLPFKSL